MMQRDGLHTRNPERFIKQVSSAVTRMPHLISAVVNDRKRNRS